MENNIGPAAWYVLHTRSRFEAKVNEGLLRKSKTVFLPKVLVRSKRRDRKQMIRVPLFPGYIFVRTDLHPVERLDILKTAGVVKFVGNMDGPVHVPDTTIASLQVMVSTDSPVTAGRQMHTGDRVVVVQGPLTGVVGRFMRYRNTHRVIVNIDALGQSAGVEVDADDLEPAHDLIDG